MEIDEAMHIVDYDPRWPCAFAREGAPIAALQANPAIALEHFGSSSVAGMKSKPIIDILIGYGGAQDLPAIEAVLAQLGYEKLGEAGVPGRSAFRKRDSGIFNVAAFQRDSEAYRNNLAIRDYLRASAQARAAYCRVKDDAIKLGITTLLGYSAYKYRFIKGLEQQAKQYLREKNP